MKVLEEFRTMALSRWLGLVTVLAAQAMIISEVVLGYRTADMVSYQMWLVTLIWGGVAARNMRRPRTPDPE